MSRGDSYLHSEPDWQVVEEAVKFTNYSTSEAVKDKRDVALAALARLREGEQTLEDNRTNWVYRALKAEAKDVSGGERQDPGSDGTIAHAPARDVLQEALRLLEQFAGATDQRAQADYLYKMPPVLQVLVREVACLREREALRAE